jgi:porphobilinogen synthase
MSREAPLTQSSTGPGLEGLKILVLRPEGQADELTRLLSDAGADPIAVPAIRILPPDSWAAVDHVLDRLHTFDWMVFTSVNGASTVLERLTARGLSINPRQTRVAAIGPATRNALEAGGVRVDWIPSRFNTRALAEELADGSNVCLIRADAANSELEETLAGRGFRVERVNAYRTEPAEQIRIRTALEQGVDVIAFTSASIVDVFVNSVGPDTRGAVVCCIGPATAEACQRAGIKVDVEGTEHTIPGLIDAMSRYYAEKPGTSATTRRRIDPPIPAEGPIPRSPEGIPGDRSEPDRRGSVDSQWEPSAEQEKRGPPMTKNIRRLRRLRRTENIRRLVAEARLSPDRFVLPVFASEDTTVEEPLSSLPGHFHWPPSRVGVIAKEAESLGIPGLLIFGVTSQKDEKGSRAFAKDGPAQQAIAEAKSAAPHLVVFADTCLCGYTSHGHCGIVEKGEVANDASVDVLAKVAVSQAEAGADFVSPSDMMDGRVAAIRRALDESGQTERGIMAYSAKFASAMYGPFRDVTDCEPQFGDRKGYQIDHTSPRQGLASIERDLQEGADIVMVKPALPYLDLIYAARQRFDAPLSAYNVSGEFAMVKAAAGQGWMDERKGGLEVLTSILRAGADFVITYHALEAARWLADGTV